MEDLVSKLLVFIAAETARFKNNARPTRVSTDCSLPETGAFCFVYNHMTLEAFCNLRVRQAFTGQPATNPVDGEALMDLIWCLSHVQHARAQQAAKKLRGNMPNGIKNLCASTRWLPVSICDTCPLSFTWSSGQR